MSFLSVSKSIFTERQFYCDPAEDGSRIHGMNLHKLFDSREQAEWALPLGKPQKLRVAGREEGICLVRTRAGIFAVADACPHLGDSLSRGTTNYLNEVVCPWHSYRFSLTNGEECEKRTRRLPVYAVQIEPTGIFIQLPA